MNVLKNVVLYAKGIHPKDEDIWGDLEKCLKADDYSVFSLRDIKQLIAAKVRDFILADNQDYRLRDFLENVNPKTCWKVGYDTVENDWANKKKPLPDYDFDTAVVYAALSLWCLASLKDLGLTTEEIAELKQNWSLMYPTVSETASTNA